jgi:hypothetical protein
MANYDQLKYSGITGSNSLSSVVSTEISSTPGVLNSSEFVAGASCTAGDVMMLVTDGTVSPITETTTTSTTSGGISVPDSVVSTFSAYPGSVRVVFNPHVANQFLVAYGDGLNSWNGFLVVGTITNGVITYGTPVVFATGPNSYKTLSFDPNTAGQFIIQYQNVGWPTYGAGIKVGTLSGSTITLGGLVTIPDAANYISAKFNPSVANQILISYHKNNWTSSSYPGYLKVGTISGTSITFGPELQNPGSGALYYEMFEFDPNRPGEFVITYTSSNELKSRYGSISGTTVSLSNYEYTHPGFTDDFYPSIDFFKGANGQSNFVIVTTSHIMTGYNQGTGLAYGSPIALPAEISTGYINMVTCSEDTFTVMTTGSSKVMTGNKPITSGSNVTIDSIIQTLPALHLDMDTQGVRNMGHNPHVPGEFVFVAANTSTTELVSYTLEVAGPTTTTTTTTNFDANAILGVSQGSSDSGENVSVLFTGGIDASRSGLTVGTQYYVQEDGSVSESSAAPAVLLGKAISTTKIQLTF